MNRRHFLQSLGAGLAGAASPARPNIVFILMDDMGWADTACYGSRYYETPAIDRLAAEGMRFTHAYAAAPLCSPTRASIMTGKYPARLHLTQVIGHRFERKPKNPRLLSGEFEDQLALGETTIAEVLRQAGYATGLVGKWHLGPKGFYPEDQGFEVNIGGTDSGMPRSFFYPGWKANTPVEGRDGEYLTDRLTEEAEGFIRRNREKPFFLYLAHHAVHVPIEGKADLVEKYKAKLRPGQLQNDPGVCRHGGKRGPERGTPDAPAGGTEAGGEHGGGLHLRQRGAGAGGQQVAPPDLQRAVCAAARGTSTKAASASR